MIPLSFHPLLLIVSAPSGAGKTTLCRRLLERFEGRMTYSVSCTTRPPRENERDGIDYRFLSPDEFERRRRNGDFLEDAEVHGNRYGTLKRDVRDAMDRRCDVLLDIDVQGARLVRERLRDGPEDDPLRRGFVDVFIAPPSIEELEARLTKRGLDDPSIVANRLAAARSECARWTDYRYAILNRNLDDAFRRLAAIVTAEHCSVR